MKFCRFFQDLSAVSVQNHYAIIEPDNNYVKITENFEKILKTQFFMVFVANFEKSWVGLFVFPP